MTDLVVVSLEAWDDIWRRNQYLVTELLRADDELRVLFVEPAADPLFALSRGHVARPGRGLRRGPSPSGVGPGRVHRHRLALYQPTKALPRRLDPGADDRLAASVERAVVRAGFTAGGRRPLLWINDPSAARLVERTGWPSLYDVTDDWVAAERTPAEHQRLLDDEASLLDRCAEVVVCSERLAAVKGGSRPVEVVTNGVDLDRYRTPAPRPADLPRGRVALYLGTVHPDRFDTAVTLATARRLAGSATVVLVGPVVDVPADTLDEFAAAGVVCLGPRPFDRVPAYLQHADVLLVPHVVDEFTDSLDPIKAYEYRAVSRPVVATPVAGFRDAVDVAVAEPEGFAALVERALDGASPPGPYLDGPVPDVPTWTAQAALMADVLARVERSATHR